MKQLFIFLFIIQLAFITNVKGQLFENFERWRSSGEAPFNYEQIPSWVSSNSYTEYAGLTALKSTDSYEGDYALELKGKKIFDKWVPGRAGFGSTEIDYLNETINRKISLIKKFDEEPIKLYGFYKYLSQDPMNKGLINVAFLREMSDSIIVNSDQSLLLDHTNEYTYFEIPISFYSTFDIDLDRPFILFSSNENQSSSSEARLFLDDLNIEFKTSSTTSFQNIFSWQIYPNLLERGDVLNIENSENQLLDLKVFNISGKQLLDIDVSNQQNGKIKTESLGSGKYLILDMITGNYQTFIIL